MTRIVSIVAGASLLAAVATAIPTAATAPLNETIPVPIGELVPTRRSSQDIQPRAIWAIAAAGLKILEVITEYVATFVDPPAPWDPASGNCVIEVRSTDGGNCIAGASPGGEAAFTDLGGWSQCFHMGEQYLTFPDAGPDRPNVGNVMVVFTKAGGITPNTGDGLRSPEIALLDLDPPVRYNMIEEYGRGFDRICTYGVADGGRTPWYRCGVPCHNAVGDFTTD